MNRIGAAATVERVMVSAYQVPTDKPESDGTLAWDSTTLVLVEITAGGLTGLGYTYADRSTAELIGRTLQPVIVGTDAMQTTARWDAMVAAIRNSGRPGICSMAIAAVDTALWDLKARVLGIPLYVLLGAARDAVPVYGSGGFTSYSIDELQEQLSTWASDGIGRVKMKIGLHPEDDAVRVQAARAAIGNSVELFVDANGAYSRKQALSMSERMAGYGVSWFEEPVSSDDLSGLRLMRERAPAAINVAAGEYGYDLIYFRRMLEACAVDVLQADATRCAGITGFMRAAALCEAYSVPLSSHCAPSIHAHADCAATPVRHLEYFHDHARIERMFFDGALTPVNGELRPDKARPGLGIEFNHKYAERYAI